MRFDTARRRAALLLIPAMLITGVACGSTDKRPVGAAEAKTPAPAQAAAATAAPGGSSAGAPAAGGEKIVIVGTDNKFDKTAITIKAKEPATVEFQNKGSAIHNWHVLSVKDSAGKDITTKLITGNTTEVITFTIDKTGAFDYLCDVHPEMKGKLTVQ